MNFKTNQGSPINILNQSYMGKTRFVNNSSRSPSPLEDISLCKAMTLENALNSRKLGTTKYLHAYNLTSSRISRKGSRATDIYPAMEEQPMILALHHEQFDESTINDPETSNPGFEQHAADALKAFVEQEEFKRSSGIQSKNKINFQEGPRASMKEEKDLLSPVL